MRLGKAPALGVFAVSYLARHRKDGPVQAREIAEALGVPPDYLLKILQQLVKARILVSTRGPAGGFTMIRPPEEVTLLAVVEAVGGPLDGQVEVYGERLENQKVKSALDQACQEGARMARDLLSRTNVLAAVADTPTR
jgi:Rrf2 family protein